MPIIRGPRPQGNFYLLDKAISEDKRLSWAARGLLIFLLGKPDNWSVSVQALVNETAGSGHRTGRDGVYTLLGQLIEAGYMRRVQANGAGGFGEIDYLVSESPLTEKPETVAPLPAEPHTAEPHTAEPFTANPTLTSIEEQQGLSGSNTLPASPLEQEPELFAQAWAAYPKRSGGNSRKDALKAWNARIKQGVSPEVLLAGVKRYAKWCAVSGKVGTAYIKQAATFFGPSEHYLEDFAVAPGAAGGKFDPLAYIHGKAQAAMAEQPFTIDGEVHHVGD